VLGRKEFPPKLVYPFSLEEAVPREHLLRRVAAAVDFGFIWRLTARFYRHTGEPGIEPVVLFKLSLLGSQYGITSERRLAEEVRLHLAYHWFLGDDLDEGPPDHSVLSKARKRFGLTVYLAFFTEVVRHWQRAGLVRGALLYGDSTLVEANASYELEAARALVAQLPEGDDRTHRLPAVETYLDEVWRENADPAPRPTATTATTPTDDRRMAAQATDQLTAAAPSRRLMRSHSSGCNGHRTATSGTCDDTRCVVADVVICITVARYVARCYTAPNGGYAYLRGETLLAVAGELPAERGCWSLRPSKEDCLWREYVVQHSFEEGHSRTPTHSYPGREKQQWARME
jgi:transposase